MAQYEYKVVPAPTKGLKAKGVKTPEARFANALENAMNELASDGWEYVRADILPSEERQGLRGSQTVYRSLLVFRRAAASAEETVPDEAAAPVPPALAAPAPSDDEPPLDQPTEEAAPEIAEPDTPSTDDLSPRGDPPLTRA